MFVQTVHSISNSPVSHSHTWVVNYSSSESNYRARLQSTMNTTTLPDKEDDRIIKDRFKSSVVVVILRVV